MFEEILGLVGVSTWGDLGGTWFSGCEYMGCLERVLV